MAYRNPNRKMRPHPKPLGWVGDTLEQLDLRIRADLAAQGRTPVTLAEVVRTLQERKDRTVNRFAPTTEASALAFLAERYRVVPDPLGGFLLPGWTPPPPVPIQPPLF